MKKVWSLVLAVCLVFGCFACQNQQEEVYSSALEEANGESSVEAEASSQPQGEEVDESGLSGTLVVSIPLDNPNLEKWADRFMDAHPGVKIVIDCQEPDSLSMSPDWSKKYIEKTVVSLTSGDAADIIDLDMTPIYRYANSGYFEDFYAT